MTETPAYVQSLMLMNALVAPVARSAVRALQLPPGSRGLDVACGIGLESVLLAEAVGPAGHVTGLDLSPKHLACARDIVGAAGLSERISFREGDMRWLPFAHDAFDWAWGKDCVADVPHLRLEALPLLKELARVVKPGGVVAILAWSCQMLLPGFPLLEARLNATSSGIAPFTRNSPPESHFARALGWLRDAGLQELSVQTFTGNAHAPLSEDVRRGLVELFEQRWPGVESELAPDDWAEFQRLCRPGSPDFVLDHPDYYAFWTYSMFRGEVARI